jgi:hypothetical protein
MLIYRYITLIVSILLLSGCVPTVKVLIYNNSGVDIDIRFENKANYLYLPNSYVSQNESIDFLLIPNGEGIFQIRIDNKTFQYNLKLFEFLDDKDSKLYLRLEKDNEIYVIGNENKKITDYANLDKLDRNECSR